MTAPLVPRPRRVLRDVPPVLAAVALAVSAAVHDDLWRHGYRALPTIGWLFESDVVAGAATALALVLRPVLAVQIAGLALSAGDLAAFLVSRTSVGLFGFQERGFRPAPQAAIAVVAELVALAVLAVCLWRSARRRRGTAAGHGLGRPGLSRPSLRHRARRSPDAVV